MQTLINKIQTNKIQTNKLINEITNYSRIKSSDRIAPKQKQELALKKSFYLYINNRDV